MPVPIGQATFAELLFVLPFGLPGYEILAGPAFAVRVSVNVIANKNCAAVMVHYDFVGIDFFRAEFAARAGDLEEIITYAIARSDINKTVVVNRRRNDCHIAASWSAPEQFAIARLHTNDTAARQLDVLPDSTDFCRH